MTIRSLPADGANWSGWAADIDTAVRAGGGASAAPPLTVAAIAGSSGALVIGKHNPVDTTGGAKTMTLPTGAANGTLLSVEKTDASTNAVTVTGNIRGAAGASISLPWQSEALLLAADAAGSWWPVAGHKTKAALDAAYAPAVSLTKYGLTNATSDIQPIIAAAMTAGARHVLVPYRAAAWPSLSTIALTDIWLEFDPGARISFNHGAAGMTMLRSRLTGASFTSDRTGPGSASDATSLDYALPARELTLFSDNVIDGSYYHEYATTGVLFNGAHNRINCSPRFKNIRHQRGWGSSLHSSGVGTYDNQVIGKVFIDGSDRGLENEDGAHDIQYLGGGYLKDVFPKGYTGQGSAVTYENYSFILDGHSHDGGGGVQGIIFGGTWILENCGGGGVTFIRSNGTNDADMPRDCRVDEVRFIGSGLATGYENLAIQGRNNHIGRAHFEAGAGIAGGSFRVQGYAGSSGNTITTVAVEGAATPVIADAGNGLAVRGFPVPLPSASRAGKFISLPNRAIANQSALSNGVLRTVPLYFPVTVTIDQLGTGIAAAGDAGSTLRIGIYSDSNGLPGSVLAEASVAADAIATPMATLTTPVTLTPGWYHVGGVVQGVTTTQPTVQGTQIATDDYPIFNPATSSGVTVGYSKTGVTGALPAWGTIVGTTNIAPRIWARVTA